MARIVSVTSAANLPFASSSSSQGGQAMSDGWCARRFLYRHLIVPLHRDEAGNQYHIGLQEVGGEDIEAASPDSRFIPHPSRALPPLFCPGSGPGPVPARAAIRRDGTRRRRWPKGGGMCCACMLRASKVNVAPLRSLSSVISYQCCVEHLMPRNV
jgi:hypothetical protein